MPTDTSTRKIVVACPCLNEANRAVEAITSLLDDKRAADFDILLLDGGSTDGTQEEVRAAFGDRVEIVHNVHRLQAHAMNMAAGIAIERGAEFLVRADLHARYPSDFISKLCATAQKTNANSVVVTMRTQGGNRVQNAARFLFSTWLGNGGAHHRAEGFRGWVEHGHHALFRVEDFARVGGYDPEFAANEDAEFDLRLVRADGRIFLEDDAAIDYFPRPTLRGSFKQFFRNGRYRVWTAVKHRERLGKRQLLPMAIAPILVLSAMIALVTPWALVIPASYIALVFFLAWHGAQCARPAVPSSVWGLAALLAIVIHIGFSAGALRGLQDLYGARRAQANRLQRRDHPDLRVTLQ
ncbi:glycosyltransferase [Ruegeria lacuscaerulensis]|uniref:glycosyltransferase n=1 Tax=Ruegeria lacuscaerulensis TaxID=55218 RepID=UPI00147A5978|nr:glycosyltransferase [Ruegeria lacuscaerulensis]